jgi:hypothetical protein
MQPVMHFMCYYYSLNEFNWTLQLIWLPQNICQRRPGFGIRLFHVDFFCERYHRECVLIAVFSLRIIHSVKRSFVHYKSKVKLSL